MNKRWVGKSVPKTNWLTKIILEVFFIIIFKLNYKENTTYSNIKKWYMKLVSRFTKIHYLLKCSSNPKHQNIYIALYIIWPISRCISIALSCFLSKLAKHHVVMEWETNFHSWLESQPNKRSMEVYNSWWHL